MQYWINQNGVQAGPVTREELEKMAVSADAYVWRSGLEDWVKITSLPELAGVISSQPQVVEPVQEQPAIPEIPAEEEPVEQPVAGESQVDEPVEQPAGEEPQPEPVANTAVEQPVTPQYAAQQPANRPPCPPTNLVWAIIATVLCCLPLGIVAIIMCNKVTQRYYAGDYEGAERASEVSAWWIIGTIIGGIVLSPFVSLVQMLMTM